VKVPEVLAVHKFPQPTLSNQQCFSRHNWKLSKPPLVNNDQTKLPSESISLHVNLFAKQLNLLLQLY